MNCQRLFGCALMLLVGVAVSATANRAIALDRDLAYLHALQAGGFGDVAVNYLEALDKSNDMSPAMREVFDLEMSKSLRVEAQMLPDPAQRGAMLTQSQKYLNQFVKNNPNHPEALQAQVSSAEMMFDHAQETIARSRIIKDKTERAASLTGARGELAQVKETLQVAVEKLNVQLKQLGPIPMIRTGRGQLVPKSHDAMTHKERDTEAKRQELNFDLIRTGGELAVVDYFTAQTYEDPKDPKRIVALAAALKSLDNYYQLHRGDDPISVLGRSGFIAASVAHTWYGKTAEEIGDRAQAKDVYDEVLETFPDPPAPNTTVKDERTGLEPTLARAKFYSLQLIATDPKTEKNYMDQAQDFLTSFKSLFHGEWGYQATSLDVAKRLLAAAGKETSAKEKSADTKQAIAILKDMTAVPSEFNYEATELLQSATAGATPTTVDEAMGYIKIAYEKKDWPQAEALIRTAIEILNKQPSKDPSTLGRLQDMLADSQFQSIKEDFVKNRDPFVEEKYVGWMNAGEKTAQENKKSVLAPEAGSFAVYCAAMLYQKARSDEQQARTPAAKKAAAAKKLDAFKRLQEIADFVITSFPNNSEADEARLTLAKAKWSDGDVADAITTFESINPKSEKYPEALKLAGELHVQQFQSELTKPAAQQDKARIEQYRSEAIKALTESVREQRSLLKAGDAIPPDLIKTQLLLAQVNMEVKDYAEAVKVLQPLVDAANAAKGNTALDETMLKIFSAAVRAYMAMDDYQRAGAAGNVLIDLGPDKREVNVVLVDFVRRLDLELRELRDKLDKLADAAPKETEALRARVASIKDMMGTMISKLASRKELGAKSLIYLGTLYSDIDDYDNAEKQYKALLARADSDPDFKKEAAPSFLWVRGQLVDLLGKRGKLDEATDQIAKLRKEKPNNLDFMKVEAQLWQEWGQRDPAKYDTAIAKWTEMRRRLQRQKAKAPDYYDAVYNASFCLLMQANKLSLNPGKKDEAIHKAELGLQVLKSELIPNPNLNGPQTVKRFKELSGDLTKFVNKLRPPGVAGSG